MDDISRLYNAIEEIKELQQEHMKITSATHDQTIKTNGRVNALEKLTEKHESRINTIWDWRMLVLGGGVIVGGLLSYLVPASIKFFNTVNDLEDVMANSKHEIALEVISILEENYSIEIQ